PGSPLKPAPSAIGYRWGLASERTMTDWPFSFTDEVRFADLDAMGHLNNVTFLAFFENARVAYVRDAIPDHDPGQYADFGFMVVETKIAYRSAGRYGEAIETLLRP